MSNKKQRLHLSYLLYNGSANWEYEAIFQTDMQICEATKIGNLLLFIDELALKFALSLNSIIIIVRHVMLVLAL